MSARKLNAVELKIHQAALAQTNKTLVQAELDALVPDAAARVSATNFLTSTGMIKILKGTSGMLSYRAVLKKELDVKKDMSGEEAMVLNHIQASGNEGIWTKHLKAKTDLHQTVIDRSLKSLVQKQLVKSVKSVKHPTRKLYMLSHLEPSVEITGGPWYTDNELDTEFIKLLSSACLHYIRDRTFPKVKRKEGSAHSQPVYAIAAAPSYPTAQQVQSFLGKSKITETQLTVEHVETLLNVLVLDGDVEKVPVFGAAMWESSIQASRDDSEEESTEKKHKSRLKESRKSKRKKTAESDESESERPRKKSGKRRKRDDTSGDEGSESEKEMKRKRRKKAADEKSEGEEQTSEDEGRKKKKRKASRDASLSSASESDSEDDGRSRSRASRTSSRRRSFSPFAAQMDSSMGDLSNAYVYRAIRQERLELGWSQAPCGRCPVFDFCKDKGKGPVNPQECNYYDKWLAKATVAVE